MSCFIITVLVARVLREATGFVLKRKGAPSITRTLQPKNPRVFLQDQGRTEQEVTTQSSQAKNKIKAWDWNITTGRSNGALIVQVENQEEFQSENQSPRPEVQSTNVSSMLLFNVDVGATKPKENSFDVACRSSLDLRPLPPLDDDFCTEERLAVLETTNARELDDAVAWMVAAPSSRKELLDSVKILPLPSVYNTAPKGQATSTRQPPFRMPEYFDRIFKDRRHLAVSIASSIEDVAQWRTFFQEGNGGLLPLLECIREGARYIHLQKEQKTKQQRYPTDGFLHQQQEESFMAACSSCRTLRDLSAVSPELAAVITDGFLRANSAFSTMTNATNYRSEVFKQLQNYEDDGATRQVHQTGNNLIHDVMTMLKYANEHLEPNPNRKSSSNSVRWGRNRRDARLRCKLYFTQLLLAMAVSSDDAVEAIRDTDELPETILKCSSYFAGGGTRRWLFDPREIMNFLLLKKKSKGSVTGDVEEASTQEGRRGEIVKPFLRAAAIQNNLDGHVCRTANQILAAIGYNRWVPKVPGQKGLRVLVLDGGGSRGMVAVSLVKGLVEAMEGVEVADSFDMIAGTSTGGIISFLCGLRREPSDLAVDRYNQLIKQIFVKSALSAPMMLFTTATYDESSFMDILSNILGDSIMLDSRSDPSVPYVFCVASKMSSTPTHVALFRNYNYASSELADPFTIDPDKARLDLDLPLSLEHEIIRKSSYQRQKQVRPNSGHRIQGSRHPGSFRVLQRYALRASTAAPTVFKPVMMGGEMYCDGGIVASNPAAVAVHEARAVFPDIPIELVVSIGTGGFVEQKNSPRIGWDGIIGQIVNSATDAEQIHHVLEDILGEGCASAVRRVPHVSQTRYFRLNPTLGLPDEFPIDVTEPAKLQRLKDIAAKYLAEPAQQRKLAEIGDILRGQRGWRK